VVALRGQGLTFAQIAQRVEVADDPLAVRLLSRAILPD
jgi:hypothetical protein